MIKVRYIIIILFVLVVSKNIIMDYFSNDDKLVIHGKISPYYSYRLKTYYEAHSSLPICYGFGSGWIWGGSIFRKKSAKFTYQPTINQNKHTITIPLNYPKLNICDYQITRITLDVPHDNDLVLFENYDVLEYTNYGSNYNNPNHRTSAVIPVLKSKNENSYNIDFYSYADYDAYIDQLELKEEVQKTTSKNTRQQLGLLHKLIISPYIRKYKKLPDELKVQKLLSQSNKMLYIEERQRKRNREKLKENITYVNGKPVDKWGNLFRSKIVRSTDFEHIVLFSLGSDGVESKDDIYSNIRQGLPDPLYDENHHIKKRAMNTSKSINLLLSSLNKYQYKYKKIATPAEAKELFKKNNKFDIHPSTSNGLDEKDLTYIDDIPVDGWGHPFIYDIKSDRLHPMVYSLGEDGIKSGDDIKRKMYRAY